MTVYSRYVKQLNKKSLRFIDISNLFLMITAVCAVMELLGIE